MLNYFQSAGDWVALIVLFGLCIFVHELGHFLAARYFGMVVETFSLGFGPAIWKKKVNGTTYKIAWFPLGGYVALPQLDPSGMEGLQGSTEGEAEKLPYVHPWKRIVVCVAGPLGNVLFAIILALIVYSWPVLPENTSVPGTVIGSIDTNSPAYSAGVKVGDEVAAVNGKQVRTWYEFNIETTLAGGKSNKVELTLRSADGERTVEVPLRIEKMGGRFVAGIHRGETCIVTAVEPGGAAEAAGLLTNDIVHAVDGVPVGGVEHFIDMIRTKADKKVLLLVERSNSKMELAVTPRFNEKYDRAMIGVGVGSLEQAVLPWMEYRNPWDQIRNDAKGIFRLLKALVTPREAGHAAGGMGGFIMIVVALWKSIQISWVSGIGFLRFLNINLAMLNLLPIPVLDGGNIIFFLWEWITGRRVNPRVQSVLVNTMAALLIAAMVWISVRDVFRLRDMMPMLRNSPGVEATTNALPGGVTNPVSIGGTEAVSPEPAVTNVP